MAITMIVAPSATLAYLDPGSAYIALQWLIGLVAGAGAIAALYLRAILTVCTRWRKRRSRHTGENDGARERNDRGQQRTPKR